MPLHHAVLALIADSPTHGYELRSRFEEAVGDQWGGLNIGHLYQVLDRLSRDGLIESEREPQPIKPDRVVHHVTEAGRRELDEWLAEPSSRLRGYRDDFFLKMMAATRTGDRDVLDGVLNRQRSHLMRELRALADARTPDTATVDDLLITAAELHIRADLGVVDAAEQRLAGTLTTPPRAAARSGRNPARRRARAAGE
ncbi:MAG TPA: PadR family transcriptional regulator [Mycobacteriales bacterium]|nr:PadR family transcriptional regulator [Mycobacteriales bacterium]